MTTLSVFLHLPVRQIESLLSAELSHRDVKSVKVDRERGVMTIEHDRKSSPSGIWL